MKGAQIFAFPPREGTWEIVAGILILTGGAVYKLGTAPKDTPIGHVIRSAYDYVMSHTLGFHVDYDKTLSQQLEEARAQDKSIKVLNESRFDSLIEKCETAIREIHRPIYKSATAQEAELVSRLGATTERIGPILTLETYEYVSYTETRPDRVELTGRV